MRQLAVALALALLIGCDNRQAVHELDVDWNRMLVQPRGMPYEPTSAFPDGQVMRVPPAGAVPHDRAGEARPPMTRALLDRGRERFEVFCAACHGVDGTGQSVVATKMVYRKPPSLHEPRLRALAAEDIERIVTNGYAFMPSYAEQLRPDERAAVASYVKALQLSRHAEVATLPDDVREKLREAKR